MNAAPDEYACIDLRDRGITIEEARKIRASFGTFAIDWDDPTMNIYDNYGAIVKQRKQNTTDTTENSYE